MSAAKEGVLAGVRALRPNDGTLWTLKLGKHVQLHVQKQRKGVVLQLHTKKPGMYEKFEEGVITHGELRRALTVFSTPDELVGEPPWTHRFSLSAFRWNLDETTTKNLSSGSVEITIQDRNQADVLYVWFVKIWNAIRDEVM